MSNSYFQFKKFRIEQDKTAMKVGTDGVLLGCLADLPVGNVRVLDIGTGTGVVALMIAQRNLNSIVDAVEIDSDAAEQARLNFDASPFRERLKVYHCDVSYMTSGDKYDRIVCNPPYFVDSLKAPDDKRNIARHNVSLTFELLAKVVSERLMPDGLATIIVPIDIEERLTICMNSFSLYIKERVFVKHNAQKAPKRVVVVYGKYKSNIVDSELVMKDGDGYTKQFGDMVADFYL